MTEAQAWRKLGEWCVTHTGWLCWRIEEWAGSCPTFYLTKAPFKAPWKDMSTRINQHSEMGTTWTDELGVAHGLDFPEIPNSNARVMFTELMALECEDSGNP